jgi:DNA-binding CsgD family transcriptional regulator
VLVIRGEPGIGKTALLDYAACRAGVEGVRVLRGAGVESETELPFAGLHLLFGSALERCSALPPPQRDALDAAFGLRHAGPDDGLLVGLAVLSLLAGLAGDGRLVCLVDDAHWLDRPSAQALVFAARRLHREGIAVVVAAGDHHRPFPAPGLPELRLGGLDAAAAAALLGEHGAGLPTQVRDRVLAQARGNPLGLIELPAAYRDGLVPAAGPGPAAGLGLTDRLRQAFGGQVRRLPEPTQTLLLVAAAQGSGELAVVLAAAATLGVAAADLGPAERAGLVVVADGTVRFRHPLVAAAVYQGAVLSRRQGVHRALADAWRGLADADRRAWHLAAAAPGPDEQAAAALEGAAARAIAGGGYAAAAAAAQRAVQLTADPAAHARRLTLAAQAAAETGELDGARRLAERAAAHTTDPVLQARLAGVRAVADFAQGRLNTAHRLLVEGAARIGGLDPPLATRLLSTAVPIAWLVGDRALLGATAQRLRAAAGPAAGPLVGLLGWPATQQRPGCGLPPLAELVAQARRARAGAREDLAGIAMVCLATGRNADACDLLADLVADAHAHGRTGWLPALLACLAQALVADGRHRDALASATHALQVARDSGHTPWASQATGVMAYLAAVDGDQQRCRRLADAALATPAGHFPLAATPWVPWALGLLELGRGRADAALAQLETIARGPARDHPSALRAIPDLVEAAVRVGQPQRAGAPLARFATWAHHADTPATHALVQRCHALVAPSGHAERHYLAALRLHQECFEQARTQLLYGAWLRRRRRKADARTQLRAAVDALDRIDAAPWATRARAELGATGATIARPGQAGVPRLTPQELQVAQLAAKGLSNRDIAARLVLSPRTVAYHLYKAYPKLGVTSRNHLDPDTLTQGREAIDVTHLDPSTPDGEHPVDQLK